MPISLLLFSVGFIAPRPTSFVFFLPAPADMWLRVTLVCCVVLWLAYEYFQPQWAAWVGAAWTRHGLYIKITVGVIAIAFVLMLPSLSAVVRQHQGTVALLRQYLVNDEYLPHFIQTGTLETDRHARAQFRDGVKLARGDANVPDEEVATEAFTATSGNGQARNVGGPVAGPTLDQQLRESAPDVRRQVHAGQQGRCVACQGQMDIEAFVVVDRGGACVRCAPLLGG